MPLSTEPDAVCINGVSFISFMFSVLHTDLNSFPVKAVPLSVLIVCGMTFSSIYCSRKVFAVFPVGASHIHGAGHLLCRSIEISI